MNCIRKIAISLLFCCLTATNGFGMGLAVKQLVDQQSIPAPIILAGQVLDHAWYNHTTLFQLTNAYIRVIERIRSKNPRWLLVPELWGGINEKWHNLQWINALPDQPNNLRAAVRKQCWLRLGQPVDGVALDGLTTAELQQLQGNNIKRAYRIPPTQTAFANDNDKEFAYALVHDQFNAIATIDQKNKTSTAKCWFKNLPLTIQREIKCYYRAAAVGRAIDVWLENDKNIDTPELLSYFIEMHTVNLPPTLMPPAGAPPFVLAGQIAAFIGQPPAHQIQLYRDDINNLIENAVPMLSLNEKIRRTQQLLKYMPDAFKKELACQYALLRDFRSDLLEHKDCFGSFEWSIPFVRVVNNGATAARIANEIRSNDPLINGILKLDNMHISDITDADILVAPVHIRNLVHTIIISNNPNVNFGAGAFASLPNLQKIIITNNGKLAQLPASLFAGQENHQIQLVDLSNNALTKDTLPNFGGTQITSLRLSGNKLTALNKSQFTHNAQNNDATIISGCLKELWVNDNELSAGASGDPLFETLKVLTGIQYLQLAGNKFNSNVFYYLASCQPTMGQLKYFSLANNKGVSNLSFEPSQNSQQFNMGGNIGIFPAGMFSNLDVLDVSFCSISAIDRIFLTIAPKISVLDLRNNTLTSLHELTAQGSALTCSKNLIRVYLGGNRLHTLNQESFKGLKNLTGLYLEGNDITKIGNDSFKELEKLETLILYGNNKKYSLNQENSKFLTQLTIEDKAFNGLKNLKHLDLSFNNIHDLPEKFLFGCTNLEKISLGFNGISTLKKDIFRRNDNHPELGYIYRKKITDNLKHIDLSGNNITSADQGSFNGVLGDGLTIYFNDNNGHLWLNKNVKAPYGAHIVREKKYTIMSGIERTITYPFRCNGWIYLIGLFGLGLATTVDGINNPSNGITRKIGATIVTKIGKLSSFFSNYYNNSKEVIKGYLSTKLAATKDFLFEQWQAMVDQSCGTCSESYPRPSRLLWDNSIANTIRMYIGAGHLATGLTLASYLLLLYGAYKITPKLCKAISLGYEYYNYPLLMRHLQTINQKEFANNASLSTYNDVYKKRRDDYVARIMQNNQKVITTKI
jgi:Leucine-rich repeat (LRR) protein